jgi:hypothetical protein
LEFRRDKGTFQERAEWKRPPLILALTRETRVL